MKKILAILLSLLTLLSCGLLSACTQNSSAETSTEETTFAPAADGPVSYTHLDVYKRQLFFHIFSLAREKIWPPEAMAVANLRQQSLSHLR